MGRASDNRARAATSRASARLCTLLLAGSLLALPSIPAAATDVELELVLLADASGSITQDEIVFQREGYASALTDPAVLNAIAGTAYGSISVQSTTTAVFEAHST